MKHCNNPVCQISWIDNHGKPTPDSNPAVGFAICTFEDGSQTATIPICAEHAKRALGFSNWKVTVLFQSCQK